MAAIRDKESRRNAQYAIPEGLYAITQGYFDIDDYLEYCHFDDEDTVDGMVVACEYDYNEFFENWEDSDVPHDRDYWDSDFLDFPMKDGILNVAIGADGLLRPVSQLNTDGDEGGYDGAVYECCPDIDDICNEEPEDDRRVEL